MTDLTSLTLAEARDALKAKSFTAVELTDAYVAAMEEARAMMKARQARFESADTLLDELEKTR